MNPNFKAVAITLLSLLSIFFSTANPQLPKYWERTVVMIEKIVPNVDGTVDTLPHGTGFVFTDSLLGNFLVTNRHLLAHRDLILMRCNKKNFDPKKDTVGYLRKPCLLTTKEGNILWKGHPNPNIDVAAIKVDLPPNLDIRELDYSRFKTFDSLEVGEDVYFFGYPLGVLTLQGKGDFPILRSGVVSYKSYEKTIIPKKFFESTVTDVEVIDSAMFLIDGFSFGGNSGSPVLTRVTPTVKAKLVGIICGHVPLIIQSAKGKDSFLFLKSGDSLLLKTQPDTVSFEQNTGLAEAICADRIRETLEQFRTKDTLQKK